ncbi:MAG: energy transducer TonB [Acidobacteriota bacterium]
MARRIRLALLIVLVFALPNPTLAQSAPDSEKLLADQRAAMTVLASMDGVWEGSAWLLLPDGSRSNLTQTERVGPFLDGAVKMVEGRGYGDNGEVVFNALGIISFDPAEGAYQMRSYAQGRQGDFPLTPTDDGFTWEIPAGPATIRYTATIHAGTWQEVGERIVEGQEPFRFFEMKLRRLGDSDWPTAGAVEPAARPKERASEHRAEGHIYDPSDEVTPPRRLDPWSFPQYTRAARKNRVEGAIILQAVIDERGNVGNVKVLRGLPHGLNKSAIQAVKGWRFEPAKQDGQPVEAHYNVTINMSLSDLDNLP